MSRRNASLGFALLMAAAALYVFWDAGRPFNETDDFWSAEIVSNMLRSGDFVVPRFAAEPDYNKPPLFYWSSAPAVAALPDLEAAMRVVPGLAFCLLLWVIHREVGRSCGPATGLAAAAVFALTYDHLHVHGFRSAVPDGLLTLESAGVLFLAARLRQQPAALLGIGALIGAAFMTKTALAVVPGAIAGAALWLDRREAPPRAPMLLGAAALCAAVVIPWFALALVREGRPLLDHMFLDQVVARFTNDPVAASTGRVFGRSEPFYVLRHYLTWAQPWSLLSAPAFVLLWLQRADLAPAERRLAALSGLWFALILGLMSASGAAWAWYAASAHVPAAIALALTLRRFVRASTRGEDRWLWAPIAASLVLLGAPLVHDPYSDSSGTLPLDRGLHGQLLLAIGLLVPLAFAKWRDQPPVASGVALLLPGLLAAALASRALGSPGLAAVIEGGAVVAALLLALRFDGPAVRRAAAGCLVAIALVYLAAPLRHAGRDHTRADVREVRALLAAGSFERGRVLTRSASLYSYVRLHQAFAGVLEVRYDPATRLLSLRRAEDAS